MATLILTRELLNALLEYMNDEKTDALEFDTDNFISQVENYNDRVFGRPDDDSPLH
jgi:hypothetical protein